MTQLELPQGLELKEFLNLKTTVDLDAYFSSSLHEPLENLFSRPRKNLRSEVVQLGFQLQSVHKSHEHEHLVSQVLPKSCEILESLHAGSLIIDDIEDQSSLRRGEPTLHLRYGLPIALNAGNWLYFWPFHKIDGLLLPPERKHTFARACHQTLLQAHYGQALDVGLRIESVPQAQIEDVILASLELKSGVLMGLALRVGGLIAGAPADELSELETWGRRLGVVLQMLDDVGNLTRVSENSKHGEDLKLRRPSFVLAEAAKVLRTDDYQNLIQTLLSDTDVSSSLQILRQHNILSKSRERALHSLVELDLDLRERYQLEGGSLSQWTKILQALEKTYV